MKFAHDPSTSFVPSVEVSGPRDRPHDWRSVIDNATQEPTYVMAQ